MENKLLILWSTIPSGGIRIGDIAEALEISPKQAGRYLKRWEAEGWLTFIPGRGRGNLSEIMWLKNVEEIYEEKALSLLDKEPVDVSSKYLAFAWSTASKLRLMNKLYTKFGFDKRTQDKLVVPRRYPFLAVHPLKAADAHSAHLSSSVFNRLVSITEDGEILPELAHSWEVRPDRLRLFLKKDVSFHDGSILVAEDAAACLEKLRTNKHYRQLWSPIERIAVPAPLVIDLIHPEGCSYSLQLLSMICAGIYKEDKSRTLGTGSFILEENSSDKTVLTAFKEHFQERPLLDAVEFIQVPRDFQVVYRSAASQEDASESKVISDSGFGSVIMNAYRDSIISKPEVRNWIHRIISKNSHTIHEYDPRASANQNGSLMVHPEPIRLPETERPVFKEPIIIRATDYTEKSTIWLKDTLEREGVPVSLRWCTFDEVIANTPASRNVDCFIHGEIFEMNQDLSYYIFLTNGLSPLYPILAKDSKWISCLHQYRHTPFSEWAALNRKLERMLLEESILIPLFYEKRQIPFSSELMNIKIKHLGYVDFSKLWVRPVIEDECGQN
ncbi:ABC transporter substrate-binding protein [Peribacillus sp. SCS-26]|uniref:ABC transporter substrate-binding protein n=1 Tax=Paraperibacillus marinus TaxID=3115295 RepID=UPI003905F01E